MDAGGTATTECPPNRGPWWKHESPDFSRGENQALRTLQFFVLFVFSFQRLGHCPVTSRKDCLCNFDQILALCGLPYLVSVAFFVTLAPRLILVCAHQGWRRRNYSLSWAEQGSRRMNRDNPLIILINAIPNAPLRTDAPLVLMITK
jgi:hypothetical protein